MTRRLVLHLALADGLSDARTSEVRSLLSSGVRSLLASLVASGSLEAGEALTCGEFMSTGAVDTRAQAVRGRVAGAEWRSVNAVGVASVRRALDAVERDSGPRVRAEEARTRVAESPRRTSGGSGR